MKHLFGFAFVILFTATGFGQPGLKAPKPVPKMNDGTELFRGLFHYYGIQPATDPLGGYRGQIVVVYGSPAPRSGVVADLIRGTLFDGGSVLIATDAGAEQNDLFSGMEPIRLLSGPVKCMTPPDCLAGNESFPLISGGWPLDGTHVLPPMRIATNAPGSIRIDGPLKYLNGFSKGFAGACKRDRGPIGSSEVFALGGAGPVPNPFRCLVLADQKVFSNRMLYASASDYNGVTPDNFRFANEVVNWLTANGTRKKCIFIENGNIKERFDDFDFTAIPPTNLPPDIPMPPLPNPLERPIQAGLAKIIDDGVAKAEDENMLNRVFTRDTRTYGWILSTGLVLLFSILIALFAFKTLQARHKANFQPLPVDPLMLGGDAPLGSFEHRRLELLRGGDFRAPVVAYLRRLFEERGLNAATAGRVFPPLDIRARKRGELKSMIRELWEEAFVFDGDPLPYTRWKEIERSLAVVRSAADANLWQFRTDKANAEDA